MTNKKFHTQFCNGNNDHRNQKQFFHTMLPALMKFSSASMLQVFVVVLGFSTICSYRALASSSDKNSPPSIGSRLKEAKKTADTVIEVKTQKPVTLSAKSSETL